MHNLSDRFDSFFKPPRTTTPAGAASALFREEGSWLAFAIEGSHAKKRKIEIGARTPDWASGQVTRHSPLATRVNKT